jgi:type IV secretion system protein VirB9
MTLRTLLAAATILHAVPAFAAVDPPAASGLDRRMRVIPYNRNNPVQLYAAPGASLRIQLGPDEEVVRIVVSDQATMAPEEEAPGGGLTVNAAMGGAAPAARGPASCDPNLCRDVMGNFVYLKPLRALDPQPLFIQTKRCAPDTGKCEMVPYAFELLTKAGDPKLTAAAAAWDVTFTYPDRDKAARLVEQRRAYAARLAAWRERQALRPAAPAAPAAAANWRYGYRGNAAVRPDGAWDDGRTTFLRFNGNRRVPNVYRQLPDGHEGLASYATEPDASGTVLRISRTETKWFIRDGDAAGCLFNVGVDPDGKAAATVASAAPMGGRL